MCKKIVLLFNSLQLKIDLIFFSVLFCHFVFGLFLHSYIFVGAVCGYKGSPLHCFLDAIIFFPQTSLDGVTVIILSSNTHRPMILDEKTVVTGRGLPYFLCVGYYFIEYNNIRRALKTYKENPQEEHSRQNCTCLLLPPSCI